MPDISFYILPSSSPEERFFFTCKLVEKAYRQGVYSVILTASDVHSQLIDELLWTFRASSFIPHQLASNTNRDTALNQILISADPAQLKQGTTLINLSQQLPEPLAQFERILEVLNQDPNILTPGRERYRHYQQAGATLTTHKL